MIRMTIKEYLSHLPKDEITNTLIYIDYWLNYIHGHNCYVFGDIGDATIDNNFIKVDKYDYLDGGCNDEGNLEDIEELCLVGILAYNGFKHHDYKITAAYKKYVKENLDLFINTGKIPRIMQGYYKEVLGNGNIVYLNNYLTEIGYFEDNEAYGRENSKQKVKSNLPNGVHYDEAAYARVLLLPAILVLVYLIIVVSYFIFFR